MAGYCPSCDRSLHPGCGPAPWPPASCGHYGDPLGPSAYAEAEEAFLAPALGENQHGPMPPPHSMRI